ncbi:MAG: hypothetical protein AAF399_25310 [Bacteroidota bacterium]
MNLENWQELWQGQQVPDHMSDQAAMEQVEGRLQKVQRQTIVTALFMSVTFAFVGIGMGWLWETVDLETPWAKVGLSLVILDMFGVLALVWTRMVIYPNQRLMLNSREFVQKSIQTLRWQDRMTRLVIPIYLSLLVLGTSMMYLEFLADAELWIQWGAHLSVIAFCGFVYFLTRPRYLRRYREKIQPLIQELENMLANWR